jgi:hypothetical protein
MPTILVDDIVYLYMPTIVTGVPVPRSCAAFPCATNHCMALIQRTSAMESTLSQCCCCHMVVTHCTLYGS